MKINLLEKTIEIHVSHKTVYGDKKAAHVDKSIPLDYYLRQETG